MKTKNIDIESTNDMYMRFKANQKRFKERMAEIRPKDVVPKNEIINQELFIKELIKKLELKDYKDIVEKNNIELKVLQAILEQAKELQNDIRSKEQHKKPKEALGMIKNWKKTKSYTNPPTKFLSWIDGKPLTKYYCYKCKHEHKIDSKIGLKHKKLYEYDNTELEML